MASANSQPPTMPSKIEQSLATLKGLDILELECMKAMVQKGIDAAQITTPIDEQDCKLLNLPAELRNLIYYFAGIIHLRTYGNTQRCGLLGVNKQIRIEFMDVFYSDKVATLHRNSQRLKCNDPPDFKLDRLSDPESLKAVLDRKQGVLRIRGDDFEPRANAQLRVLQVRGTFLHDSPEDRLRYPWMFGVLELETGDSACCSYCARRCFALGSGDVSEGSV